MLISELIEQLQGMYKTHGDLEVYYEDLYTPQAPINYVIDEFYGSSVITLSQQYPDY